VLFPLFARRRPSVRVLVGVLVGVLVASLILRGIGAAADVSDVRLQWRTHFRMDSLAAGLLLAVLRVHAPASFERLQRRRWLWAALTATGVAFLAVVGKGGALGSTLGYTVAYVTGAAFLLLLHGAAWVPRAGWLSRPLAALGRYSYGIYIWHLFAAQSVLSWLPGLDYHSTTPLAQTVKFGVAIGAGVLATVVVDRPTLRLRDRLLPATARVEAGSPAPERSRGPATLSARELSADRMAA
jgi:peptidoglycan/LPS O-acetylase OafA/YrhL